VTAPTVDITSALRDRIANAGARGAAIRVVCGSTWLDAGRPTRDAETVSLREYSGITEYVPGDLTLTARAGTTLAELRDATNDNGQWLALDPFGSDDGTLGATVATASAGPLRTSFGSPRDLVLGLEFVTGAGVLARSGGRVVKNVAGFDVSRLLTGSWGTLAVITEITVRLHARPAADETLAIAIDGSAGVSHIRAALRCMPFTPLACEILNDTLADDTVNVREPTALFRLGGNAESVRAQRAAITSLGGARDVSVDVWTRLRRAEPGGAIVFRLSRSSSEIGATWTDAMSLAHECDGVMIHASPTRGVVRCIVPNTPAAVAGLSEWFAAQSGGTRIGERLPATLWDACSPPPALDRLSREVKRTFDPRGILNPGILGESP
jgi:glycolate oxidase FAD binding subunit